MEKKDTTPLHKKMIENINKKNEYNALGITAAFAGLQSAPLVSKYRMDTYKPKIDVYKSEANGEWRWKMTAHNGNEIGASTESYNNKKDCISNMKTVGEALMKWADEHKD